MTSPTMTARAAYARSIEAFDAIIPQVREDQWTAPTPCSEWNIRALVNHVVGENRWVPPLLSGQTITDIGDALDGDLLGIAPLSAWQAARDEALSAVSETADDQPVELSSGTTPAAEYLRQLAADHLIHAWDLATAIGVDLRFDDQLAESVHSWFTAREDDYRQAGVIGPRVPVVDDADTQALLLAAFGRARSDTTAVVKRFGTAFNSRDLDAIMACTTPDCLFESTAPPDGQRYEGQVAVREAWRQLFADAAAATFTEESMQVFGDRAVVQWRYNWNGAQPGHVRGIDLFHIRDGLVAEKVSYVKG